MAPTYDRDPPDTILELLGGGAVVDPSLPRTEAVVQVVRSGLPYATVEVVADFAATSPETVRGVIGLTGRTASRRRRTDRLSSSESDRLYRVVRVLAHAVAVLGDVGRARDWVHRPSRALGGATPWSWLDTDAGAKEVDDVLTRLDYGVFG